MTQKTWYPTFREYLRAEYAGPFVATDIIIRHNPAGEDGDPALEGIVLIERKHEPFGYSLPGGMAECMTLPENAVKEAREETGLHVILDEPVTKPCYVSSNVNRDPRAFIMSVTYAGVGTGTLCPHPDEDATRAFVVPYKRLEALVHEPVWAFQAHAEAVKAYLAERAR
jgi:8-oxo-dGTP diphosphatase